MEDIILCDGNYGLGAYGMNLMYNRKPERSGLNRKEFDRSLNSEIKLMLFIVTNQSIKFHFVLVYSIWSFHYVVIMPAESIILWRSNTRVQTPSNERKSSIVKEMANHF